MSTSDAEASYIHRFASTAQGEIYVSKTVLMVQPFWKNNFVK